MDEGEEVDGSPVVSGCDSAEMLELVEASFDLIAQLVEGEVVGDEAFSGWVAGDDGLGALAGDEFAQGVAVIGLVSDHVVGLEALKQGGRLRGIAALTRGEDNAHRAPPTVDGEVDLGGQSSSGSPQSLVLAPPFPVAAC